MENMEAEALDRYGGRDGLFRALVFIFFLVGAMPGKGLLAGLLEAPPGTETSAAVFALLVLLALTFTGLPAGFAMLPVCALLAGAYVGFLAEHIVRVYLAGGVIDKSALILCAVFTPVYFVLGHGGLRCCGMLARALERCGESARAEYSKAFIPLAVAIVLMALAFYFVLRQ